MKIDASTVGAHTTRNDLIRQAAHANRSQRLFGADVLGKGPRSQTFSFRSALDRVNLSAQAKGAAANANVAATATPTPAPGTSIEPTPILPPTTPNPALSQTIEPPTYTKPRPAATPPGSEFKFELEIDGDEIKIQFESKAPELTLPPSSEHEIDDDHEGHHDDDRFDDDHDLDSSEHHGKDPSLTMPPVVSSAITPDAVHIDTKFDASATQEVVGGAAVAKAPVPEPQAQTVLPTSVVQEQILSAFGAIDGDSAYSTALDFDGDGMIGLNDLNHLFFQD